MPKFLITYHGGGAPAAEEAQQAMAAFMAWASSAGEALRRSRRTAWPGQDRQRQLGCRGHSGRPGEWLLDPAGRRPGQCGRPGQGPPFISRGGFLQVSTAMQPG